MTDKNKTKDTELSKTNNFCEEYASYINKYNDYYNDIISKICHEFYNPLTLINSTMQLMEAKHPTINEIEYWSLIKKDVKDCIELINNFKEFRNFIELNLSNQNLLSLIESVVNSFYPIAEQNNIELKLIISKNTKYDYLNYLFDKIRLKQVFVNLIKNALESTKAKGYVHVVCKSNHTNLIIEIKDNGDPITEKEQKTIFEPYVTTKKSGTGLGLPISKAITMSHMGTLNLKSTDEETSFIIMLPRY